MAESYSVKAILSAQDKSFSKTMKSAGKSLSSLKSTITGGLGFGIMAGVGAKAFSAISSGIGNIISGMSEASATWKTFQGNMEMTGKSDKQIARTKKSLQDFAQATIYSSSDMASTYAQLSAVGTKHTTKLVKGFGGLAAAAQNPKQAMKTLSQQATQAAAKPTIQWQDFKLMLEQTPAGMAAVAKTMGKSTKQLVKDVQDGKVATEDFFDAVAKTGTNKSFTKLAMQYKTVDEAMDGLTETLSNKLQPAYNKVSRVGIAAISGIADAAANVDGKALAKKIQTMVDSAKPYWDSFKDHAMTVASAFGEAGSAIGDSIKKINDAAGNNGGLESFNSVLDTITGGLTTFAGFLQEHSDVVAVVVNHLPQLLAAYMAFRAVKTVAPGMMLFGRAISAVGMAVGGKIAGKLFGIGKGADAAGKSASASGKQMLTASKSFALMGVGVLLISAGFALLADAAVSVASAGPAATAVLFGLIGAVAAFGAGITVMLNSIKPGPAKLKAIATAMLAMGVAVVLVSAGFAILANAAINLASAGPAAIAVMAGMVLAIAGLAAGVAVIGPALTASAVGMIAFGAAILIAGAGMMLMAQAAIQLSAAGAPAIACMAGMVVAIALLAVGAAALGPALLVGGAALVVFGAGLLVVSAAALVAGVALLIVSAALPNVAAYGSAAAAAIVMLGAGMVVFAAGAALSGAAVIVLGAGLIVATAGILTFGAGILIASAGVLVFAAGVLAIGASMSSIASNAHSAAASLTIMMGSISVVKAGLSGLGDMAKSAMDSIISAFDNTAGKAQSSGQKIGQNFGNALRGKLQQAVSVSRQMSNSVSTALASGKSKAYQCGVYIGQGFANGMRSMLSTVRAAATELAAQADKAMAAKAKIGSPSKITTQYGKWWGVGYANGMHAMVGRVRAASAELVTLPIVSTPSMAMTGGGTLPDNYSYGGAVYTIIVPLEIDGREFARTTATYTKVELDTMQRRDDRKRGRVKEGE